MKKYIQQPTSLILFGHGARDPAWAEPMERLQKAILKHRPQIEVRLAFLEFMQPTLPEAIDQSVANGALHIAIIPVFLAQGGHVKRDVPLMLQAARKRHSQVSITLRHTVGEAQQVIDAMALYALTMD